MALQFWQNAPSGHSDKFLWSGIYPLHVCGHHISVTHFLGHVFNSFSANFWPIWPIFGPEIVFKSIWSIARGFLPPTYGGVNSHVNLHMNLPSGRHMFWPPSRVLNRKIMLPDCLETPANPTGTPRDPWTYPLNIDHFTVWPPMATQGVVNPKWVSESTLTSKSLLKRAQTQWDLFGNPHYHWVWKIFHLGKFTCEFTFHGNDHPVGRNTPLGTKYTHRVHWGTVFHPWSPLDLRSHQGPQIDDWPPPGWTVMVNSPHGCPLSPWVR